VLNLMDEIIAQAKGSDGWQQESYVQSVQLAEARFTDDCGGEDIVELVWWPVLHMSN
jgi:uncharacterized protein CbrC (UPF0167 family)